MGPFGRTVAKVGAGIAVAAASFVLSSGASTAAPKTKAPIAACVDPTAATNVWYENQNHVVLATSSATIPAEILGVHPGDTVTVHFLVQSTDACHDGVQLSFVSYSAQQPTFSPYQALFAADTHTFAAPGGPYTLTVMVPQTSASTSDPDCNPQHDNSNGGGANQSPGPYDPNGCGLPSGNGKSDNNNSNKPCAGCVGNADAKNPPGQYPNGGDPNAGYECDRNQGVGQTNPAHTGCGGSPFFQLDFVSGTPITDFNGTSYDGQHRLINYANG
jgi:hypothetical protein